MTPTPLTALPQTTNVLHVEDFYCAIRNSQGLPAEGSEPMADRLNLHIAGEWRPARDGDLREIRCPAYIQLVATAADASPGDAWAAMTAARRSVDLGRTRS